MRQPKGSLTPLQAAALRHLAMMQDVTGKTGIFFEEIGRQFVDLLRIRLAPRGLVRIQQFGALNRYSITQKGREAIAHDANTADTKTNRSAEGAGQTASRIGQGVADV